MDTIEIEQKYEINGLPEHVFAALTTHVDEWWNHGFASPDSTFRLEPNLGGRFFEDFGEGNGGSLFATVTHIETGSLLKLMGTMGMSGAVIGSIRYELEPQEQGTILKLSHHIIGELDEETRVTYEEGWQELLGVMLKNFVERGQKYREIPTKA